MKLTDDPRRNIGYLRFHEETAEVETIQVGDSLNVDIAPDGTEEGRLMNEDPVVAEVRRIRQQRASRFNYDIHKIFADLIMRKG